MCVYDVVVLVPGTRYLVPVPRSPVPTTAAPWYHPTAYRCIIMRALIQESASRPTDAHLLYLLTSPILILGEIKLQSNKNSLHHSNPILAVKVVNEDGY